VRKGKNGEKKRVGITRKRGNGINCINNYGVGRKKLIRGTEQKCSAQRGGKEFAGRGKGSADQREGHKTLGSEEKLGKKKGGGTYTKWRQHFLVLASPPKKEKRIPRERVTGPENHGLICRDGLGGGKKLGKVSFGKTTVRVTKARNKGPAWNN